MQTLDHDEVSLHINAVPEQLYDIIADVTRMPDLSPELVRCEWLDGATGAPTCAWAWSRRWSGSGR